jgi:hypothetical protein
MLVLREGSGFGLDPFSLTVGKPQDAMTRAIAAVVWDVGWWSAWTKLKVYE